MTDRKETRQSILFYLDRIEDDHPPAATETVHVIPTEDGHFEVDSIPLFVRGIYRRDVVAAREDNGTLVFDRLIRSSGHLTIRVIDQTATNTQTLHQGLHALGCAFALSRLPPLLAVDVPPDADLRAILRFFAQGQAENRWRYELSILPRTEPGSRPAIGASVPPMPGLTFANQDDSVDVDLHHILADIFSAATGFAWHITAHDWAGTDEATFGTIAERGTWLTDDDLRSLARLDLQLIDATLTGCDPQRKTPLVIVRAVDGTWWDVESNDPAILAAIRHHFPAARPFPTN